MAQVWIWNNFGTQMVRADSIITIESRVSGSEAQVSVTTAGGSTLVQVKAVGREADGDFDYSAAEIEAQCMAVQLAHAIAVAETSNVPVQTLNFMAEEKAPA